MPESLRIALLLDPLSLKFEGAHLRVKWGTHAQELAAELLGRGHTVRGFGAPPGLIPRSSEVPVTRPASAPLPGPTPGHSLRSFAPTVLLAYDALSPAAARGARMARVCGAALVLVESALPHGGPWHERARHRVGEWLWGAYVRRVTGGVVALDAVARGRALREGFPEELIREIPFGVDTHAYRPGLTSRLVPQHRIRGRILLYVGPLEPRHGVETLIAAFARTVGQRSDWSLVLAGGGSLAPALRAQCHRLGVADRVHWLPRPRREELPGMMAASTLLAVPATDDLVMGRHVGRALASGLPVLASDLERLRDWVVPGETGLLVHSGDDEAWAEAIGQAASSPTARRRWAETGRSLAEERFAWPEVARQFEEVFLQARERVRLKMDGSSGASLPPPEEKP